MENIINDVHLFVAVCRTRNFRRAAAALGMPESTLSRRIAALEKRVGLKLLNRSPRKFELTEDGQVYLNRIGPLVEDILLAHDELRDRKSQPHGHLRVSMPHGVAMGVGMAWLGEFAEQYGDITYEINTEPANIDILADRFDIGLWLKAPADTQLYVRRVGAFSHFLYASPAYLARHPPPERPDELARHECIRYARTPQSWTISRDDISVSVDVHGRFLCDAPDLARPLAVAGRGIAQILPHSAAAEAAAGRLIRVLPDWRCEAAPLFLVTPTNLLPRRTRLLADFLIAKVRSFDS